MNVQNALTTPKKTDALLMKYKLPSVAKITREQKEERMRRQIELATYTAARLIPSRYRVRIDSHPLWNGFLRLILRTDFKFPRRNKS